MEKNKYVIILIGCLGISLMVGILFYLQYENKTINIKSRNIPQNEESISKSRYKSKENLSNNKYTENTAKPKDNIKTMSHRQNTTILNGRGNKLLPVPKTELSQQNKSNDFIEKDKEGQYLVEEELEIALNNIFGESLPEQTKIEIINIQNNMVFNSNSLFEQFENGYISEKEYYLRVDEIYQESLNRLENILSEDEFRRLVDGE